MNRNRILHPKGEWQYIGVPVRKEPRGTAISKIRVLDLQAAHQRIISQCQHYKNVAPHFDEVMEILEQVFRSTESDRLVDLNISSLKIVSEYLGLNFSYTRSSQEGFDYSKVTDAGEWALEISSQYGATHYINPVGGQNLFDPNKFKNRNLSLSFLVCPSFSYPSGHYKFEENLSIVEIS